MAFWIIFALACALAALVVAAVYEPEPTNEE
jgi:hypothetical protein